MTGKDLILFIINNNLMNTEFGIDESVDGMFMNAEKTAIKLGVSTSSLLDMARLGIIDSVDVDGKKYFCKNIDLSALRIGTKFKKEIV